MGNDFTSSLRPAIVMTILFAILLGVLYPLAMTGVGQMIFPSQANGSLVKDKRGIVIGSTVIGQAFTSDRYFHTRPSAAGDGYDGVASSGSNLGPTSQALVDRIKPDIEKLRADGVKGDVPADMVTASGSGLDPDVSPQTAMVQAARVAAARGLAEEEVRALVTKHIDRPLLGVLGEDRVNVFALNRALDRNGAGSSQ